MRCNLYNTMCNFRWIKNEYSNPDVFILENGYPTNGEIEDDDRIEYFHDHLQQVQNAIHNDGCNVKAYTGNNLKSSAYFKALSTA